MIAFDNHYNFSAENVDYIEASLVGGENYPYRLTVHTKSGKAFSVYYNNSENCDAAKSKLVSEIEREKRAENEKLLHSLYLICSDTRRIDQRQLRDLLGIRVEED